MRQGAHAVNVKLEAALAYSRMRWRIFPCHSIVNGRCSCGKASCNSPGKHPRTKAGFKEATDDEAQIRRWWARWPDANIALATGSGLAVIDIDGEEGFREFQELVKAQEPLPPTLVAQTGRGHHLVFSTRPDSPQIRSSARGNVHVRGEGGYIIVAPSNHISGNDYKWIKQNPVAVIPEWLRQWSQGYDIANKSRSGTVFDHLPALPAHLSGQTVKDISSLAAESLKTVWTQAEHVRLVSALAAIPSDDYEIWYQVGMALQGLGWERSDGSDIGFTIWDEWSQLCPDKYALGTCEEKWRGFARTARGEITLGTIYHLAAQHGWNLAPSPVEPPKPAGSNGHHAGPAMLPSAFLAGQKAIVWPDVTEEGKPRTTMTNAKVAISALGLDCRYDLFHNRMLVAGELISKWNSSELSDHVTTMVRDLIRYRFGFDPNKTNVQDACEALCLSRRFDPVLDYLDSLIWDRQPRLDRWLTTYMGAADTELNRAISRLSLIAAVRRAYNPGTKFDQVIVLEGPQGQGKSEAIEVLAGAENFSDQSILGVDDRKQQELTEGVWLYEIGELSGLRKAEIEHVKAFASRKNDRARPAYGRYTVSQPRRTVFFASTNQSVYLQDDTGNRRFWPVTVSRIALAALRRDRDQLWAEAAVREAEAESHFLPEALWHAAHEEQEKRMQSDGWLELIHNYLNLTDRIKHDVSVMDVLCDNQFIRMTPDQVKHGDTVKAGRVLTQLKFERYQKRLDDGTRIWRYRRPRI